MFLAEALGIAWNALFVLALMLLHMFNSGTAEFTIITGFMAALFGYIIGRRIGSDSYKYCGGYSYMHASGAGEGWGTPSEDRYMVEMLESVRRWRPYVERWGHMKTGAAWSMNWDSAIPVTASIFIDDAKSSKAKPPMVYSTGRRERKKLIRYAAFLAGLFTAAVAAVISIVLLAEHVPPPLSDIAEVAILLAVVFAINIFLCFTPCDATSTRKSYNEK